MATGALMQAGEEEMTETDQTPASGGNKTSFNIEILKGAARFIAAGRSTTGGGDGFWISDGNMP